MLVKGATVGITLYSLSIWSLTTYTSVKWHDDVIKRKHFPRYGPFVTGIHQWPVDSPHQGHWSGALMFCLICAWANDWANNRDAGDLRRHRAHTNLKPGDVYVGEMNQRWTVAYSVPSQWHNQRWLSLTRSHKNGNRISYLILDWGMLSIRHPHGSHSIM